jgi:type IV pilus assembly protein PilN
MIRINLLPVRASRKKQAGRQQVAALAALLIFGLVANFAWSRSRDATLASGEAKLKATRTEIAQLERIIGEVKSIKAQQATVKDKLAVLDRLKAGRQGPVRVLDDLSTLIPKKLWLRKLDEKVGAISFEGVAASIDDVSAFLSALKRSQYFTSPELRKTVAKAERNVKLVDFTITAGVNYTPTAPVTAAPPPAAASPAAVAATPEKR